MSKKLAGYNGKIAYINLSTKKIEIEDLAPEIARDYIGGTGLSAKLIYDFLSEHDYNSLKNDIFSEINPIVFATGPLTGSIKPSSGRFSVSGISPLTHQWGEGTSGGFFCISLRNSGYDAIFITGKAKRPTYIYINDGKIELKDADKIWGKNSYETQEIIKNQLGESNIRIACIGIAGENLVKYAAIINDDGRAQGRCGLGAIMGSKKLKAIAIRGTNKIEGQNLKKMRRLRENIDAVQEFDMMHRMLNFVFNLYGTNSYMDMGTAFGDVPAFYFTETEFLAESLTGKTIKEEYPVFTTGCWGCTLRCGKETIVNKDDKEIKVDGPEYESMASLGALCGVFDSKSVILAHHLCNEYGLDTISTGVSIAFLYYLVENNLGINKIKDYLQQIKIGDIHWGNAELLLELVEKIAKREGVGRLLAEGTKVMAKELGIDPGLAAHVKGLEIPMHEPRASAGQALTYMTGCRGACHLKGDWFNVEMGGMNHPKFDIVRGNKEVITGRERGVITLQDIRAIDDSAVTCNFVTPPKLYQIARYISFATARKYDKNSLIQCGERINNIKRVISCNMGISRIDDYLPTHALKILETGVTAGIKLELEENLKNYYNIRGWNWETGRPKDEKLRELQIL